MNKDFSKKQEFYFHKVLKILGAKNRWKNLTKHPGSTFQITPRPGYFSRAGISILLSMETWKDWQKIIIIVYLNIILLPDF